VANDGRQGSAGQGHTQSELGGVADGIPTRLDGHLGFEREPNIPRVATGIPDRVNRLKALGNSIVPQIVYNIGLAILEEEKRTNVTKIKQGGSVYWSVCISVRLVSINACATAKGELHSPS
jgi:hypothetical protein